MPRGGVRLHENNLADSNTIAMTTFLYVIPCLTRNPVRNDNAA